MLRNLVITLVSGGIGVLAALAVTAVANALPLPTMFAGLPVTS
ncbi:MAG: hypothetical protein N3G20_03225 [Verrucomicrobiae bacterium]|nr:hypothetical protein [Verrucomicrobiae bacterium]